MFARVHEHEVRSDLFARLLAVWFHLLALKVAVPEVEVEALLRVDGSNEDEAATRAPVDCVAVLLLDGSHGGELAEAELELLGRVEVNAHFRGDGRARDGVVGSDEDEAVAEGLPGEVDDDLFQLDDLHGDVFLLDSEELERGVGAFFGLGVAVNLDAQVFACRLPM